jgi:hypothetical protein
MTSRETLRRWLPENVLQSLIDEGVIVLPPEEREEPSVVVDSLAITEQEPEA